MQQHTVKMGQYTDCIILLIIHKQFCIIFMQKKIIKLSSLADRRFYNEMNLITKTQIKNLNQ